MAEIENPCFREICSRVCRDWQPSRWKNLGMVLAVSGGPDSVLVLRVMLELVGPQNARFLNVAHFHHGIRESADFDQQFVEELARQFGLNFETSRSSPSSSNVSEEQLRNQRYEFLREVALRTGSRYILMGHNRDDQIETLLFRFCRGTGISGLAGIPQFRKLASGITIARPLLKTARSEIIVALKEIGQASRTDESNLESTITRNHLRNEILPSLRTRFPGVDEAIVRLGKQAAEVDEYLTAQVEPLTTFVRVDSPEQITIQRSLPGQLPTILLSQLLRKVWIDVNWPRQQMTRKWWERLCEWIQNPDRPVSLNLPGSIRAETSADGWRLTRASKTDDP